MPPGHYDLTAGFYSAGTTNDLPHLAANCARSLGFARP